MTITDLEYAARAAKRAGLDVEFDAESGKAFDSLSNEWDPRLHDGEAFRLASALALNINQEVQTQVHIFMHIPGLVFSERVLGQNDQLPALRRATFRAAVISERARR